MPRLDVAATSQAVSPFLTTVYFSRESDFVVLMVVRGGEFPPPSHNALNDGPSAVAVRAD